MKTFFTVNGRTIEARLLGKGLTTVLFFHGFGSSAAVLPADELLLTQNDVQLLCLNRPAIGGSSAVKPYTIASVAADAKAVLAQLQVNSCVVAGWSAGGLFAQAFAERFPEMVLSLHLVSSAIPFGNKDARQVVPSRWKSIAFVNRYFPFVTRILFKCVSQKAQKNLVQLMRQSISEMVPADKAVACDRRFYPLLQTAAAEGFANNGLGVLQEANALGKATINYSRITCPVQIWTGGQDNIWPVATAEYLHHRLPQAQLHLFRQAGHLLFLKEWKKLVAAFALEPA